MNKSRLLKVLIILFLYLPASAAIRPAMTAFNAGEVSPLMLLRYNFQKYNNACQTLQNMLPLSQGPVTRRPGLKYIADVNDHDKEVWLGSFEFAKTDAYALEWGYHYMRVYRNGGQVLSGANPYEITTPFEESELSDIQYVQLADVMYIVDGNDPPQELTRTGHASWTIADVGYEDGPFMDENITATEITPSGTTGSITLVADANIWTADHVGALWQIGHRRAQASINGILDANESSSQISCYGDYDLNVQGTWEGTVTLERSFDSNATWESVGYSQYNKDSAINEDYAGSEDEDGVLYRVTMTEYVSAGSATYNFNVLDYIDYGIVEITAFTDANEVTATVLSDLTDTAATAKWSEGYWSDENGWPQTVEFHEFRLFYGGSTSYPQTIWATRTDDYDNMTEGTTDSHALIHTLPGQNPIQWMRSHTYLMIGTLGGAGRLGQEDEAMTPTTVPIYRHQSTDGSAYMQAVMASDAILYVERGGQKIREFVYVLEQDRFVSPDMSELAEHITGDGIVDIAYQSRPDSTLWCIRDDGNILSMTYNRRQDVLAWAMHVTDGDAESVTVIPGTDEDEVWFVINRTIDGNTKRYIEQMQPRDWGTDNADCFFIDSGLTFDGGDAVNMSAVTQADPGVVTVSTWPTDGDGTNLGDGDQVKIVSVVGMTELNSNIYSISDPNVTDKTFALRNSADTADVNSVGYTAYVSGGTVQRFEKNFSGFDHLEGETVSVLADGSSQTDTTISSGTFAINVWANKVHAGLPFNSILETMPIVIDTQEGSIASRRKQVTQVDINFYESLGTKYGVEGDTDDVFDETSLVSDWKALTFQHGLVREATIYLEQVKPYPLTIRGIIPKLSVFER